MGRPRKNPHELQRTFGITLDEPTARQVAEYAQHLNVPCHQAVYELLRMGLSLDIMSVSAAMTRARVAEEVRAYAANRMAAMAREIAREIEATFIPANMAELPTYHYPRGGLGHKPDPSLPRTTP